MDTGSGTGQRSATGWLSYGPAHDPRHAVNPVEASSDTDELIGVVPAAGWARRSAPLPCSKEIFPIGFHTPAPNGQSTSESAEPTRSAWPKPACGYLLEAMRIAEARRAVIGLRSSKWDIPACLADGAAYDLALAYTVIDDSPGVPWTVRRALSFVAGARVLFGFPDIVFRPADALERLERRQRQVGADVVLGLFPVRRPEKMDMVALDAEGRVENIVIKPRVTELRYTWILAAWTSRFSDYLIEHLRAVDAGRASWDSEVHLGDVMRAALVDGWRIDAVEVPDGEYRDIGTPDELAEAVRQFG